MGLNRETKGPHGLYPVLGLVALFVLGGLFFSLVVDQGQSHRETLSGVSQGGPPKPDPAPEQSPSDRLVPSTPASTNLEPTKSTGEMLAEAKLVFSIGNYDKAESLAEALIHKELEGSRNNTILAGGDAILGKCLYKKKDLSGAIAKVSDACRRDPDSSDYRTLLTLLKSEYSSQQRQKAESLLTDASGILFKGKGIANTDSKSLETVINYCEFSRSTFTEFGGTNQQIAKALWLKGLATAMSGREQEALSIVRAARKLKDDKAYRDLEQLIVARLNAARASRTEVPTLAPQPAVSAPSGQYSGSSIESGHAVVEQVIRDFCLVETSTGYGVIEIYSGTVEEGDSIVGTVESYGLFDLHNATTDTEISGYVEEYGLSKEDALEKLVEKAK